MFKSEDKIETVKRSFATVTVGKGAKARNVAEELLALGYVTAVRHRNDAERSQASIGRAHV